MHSLAHSRRRPRPRGGFIHVPYLTAQARRHRGKPGLSLEKMIEAVRQAVAVSLRQRRDLRVAAGQTH